MRLTIIYGNSFEKLKDIPEESIDLCITSPPYWGLRKYGIEPISIDDWQGEYGNEPNLELYMDHTMLWIKEVFRVLKPTGSFVLNIGDCFIGGGRGGIYQTQSTGILKRYNMANQGPMDWHALKKISRIYKKRQFLSVSSFLYCRIISETDFVCRGEHIWCKPNVPSPIRSRLKHSHEKLFWFVKNNDSYYFDSRPWLKEILMPCINTQKQHAPSKEKDSPHCNNIELSATSCYRAGKGNDYLKNSETIEHSWRVIPVGGKQSGFEIGERLLSEHVAPYPETLIAPYIKSLCPPDGVILDPFLGSGTTMRVAMENMRSCIGIELNAKSVEYAKKRVNWGAGLGVEYSEG